MSVPFVEACGNGDEKKARQLYDSDKSVLNRQDERDGGEIEGFTGLHNAFSKTHFSICRWLLSLPDIDVNLKDFVDGVTLGGVQGSCRHRDAALA